MKKNISKMFVFLLVFAFILAGCDNSGMGGPKASFDYEDTVIGEPDSCCGDECDCGTECSCDDDCTCDDCAKGGGDGTEGDGNSTEGDGNGTEGNSGSDACDCGDQGCDCDKGSCNCCKTCDSKDKDNCSCHKQCGKSAKDCDCCKICGKKAGDNCGCHKQCGKSAKDCDCCKICGKKAGDNCGCHKQCGKKAGECDCCDVCGKTAEDCDCPPVVVEPEPTPEPETPPVVVVTAPDTPPVVDKDNDDLTNMKDVEDALNKGKEIEFKGVDGNAISWNNGNANRTYYLPSGEAVFKVISVNRSGSIKGLDIEIYIPNVNVQIVLKGSKQSNNPITGKTGSFSVESGASFSFVISKNLTIVD